MDHFCNVCVVFVCHTVLSVPCSLVVTWPLGSLVCDVFMCFRVHLPFFPYGVLGQVWYSIVSIPDLCLLAYFYTMTYGSISTATLYLYGLFKCIVLFSL